MRSIPHVLPVRPSWLILNQLRLEELAEAALSTLARLTVACKRAGRWSDAIKYSLVDHRAMVGGSDGVLNITRGLGTADNVTPPGADLSTSGDINNLGGVGTIIAAKHAGAGALDRLEMTKEFSQVIQFLPSEKTYVVRACDTNADALSLVGTVDGDLLEDCVCVGSTSHKSEEGKELHV
jgi:hypothetical protein